MGNHVINAIIAPTIGADLKEVEVYENLNFTTPSNGAALANNISFVQNVIESGQSLKRRSSVIKTDCVREFVRRNPKQAIAQVSYLYAIAIPTVGTEYAVNISRTEAGLYEPFMKFYSVVAGTGETALSILEKLAARINLESKETDIYATAVNSGVTFGFSNPALFINNTTSDPMRSFTVTTKSGVGGNSIFSIVPTAAYPYKGVGTYDIVKDYEDTSKKYAGVQSTWFAGPYNNEVSYVEEAYNSAVVPISTTATNVVTQPTFTGYTLVAGMEIIINSKSFIILFMYGGNMLISGVTVANAASTPQLKKGYTTLVINTKEFRNEFMAVGSTPMPETNTVFVRDTTAFVDAFVTKIQTLIGRTVVVV